MTAIVRSVGTPGTTGAGTATTFSPAMPAGFQAGDLLIGIVGYGNGTVPSSRPTGSTVIQNVVDGTVYGIDVVRKVAVGGDTFTWGVGTARKWVGVVIAIRIGTYDVITPIQGNVGAAQGTTAALTFVTPSSTPSNSDPLTIAAFGQQGAATWQCNDTQPSMTELCDTSSSGTGAASIGVYRSLTPHNNTAFTRTGTATLSSANGCAFMMHVNPSYIRLRRQRPQLKR